MEVGSSSLPGTTSQHFSSDIDGGLAQLARAPALQAGGQRFESVILHVSENFRIGDARSQSLKILHVGNHTNFCKGI